MITASEKANAQQRAAEMMREAGIQIRDGVISRIEVVDFGLSHLEVEGVQVLTMVSTDRLAAKVLVLFPNQTEPEHWHPKVGDDPGKQETIRHIWGDLRFYVDGEDDIKEGFLVEGKEDVYTLRHELVLHRVISSPLSRMRSTGFKPVREALCCIVFRQPCGMVWTDLRIRPFNV